MLRENPNEMSLHGASMVMRDSDQVLLASVGPQVLNPKLLNSNAMPVDRLR